jgi:hypothetical protein
MGQGQGGPAPVMRFKCYPVEIAIWAEQKTSDNGQQYMDYSFKLSKSFKSNKTPSGYDHRDIPLFGDDLLKAATLLQKAYDFTQVKAETPQGQGGGGGGRRR